MSDVLIERKGGLLSLRFNRPEKKNAITQDMYLVLADALENLDPSVRVVKFSGEGGCFTAGNDLKDFLAAPPADTNHPTIRFIKLLPKVPVPMVAQVEGPAVGIGTTLLLHCDLVVAATNASFAVPFVKLGLVPEAASSHLLPKLMGYQRAASMLLLGDTVDAVMAERFGLVTHLVEAAALSETAERLVHKLLSLPPAALRATKKLMHVDPVPQMDAELMVFVERLKSEEFKEAATAFLEKRAPDFSRF